MFEEDRQRDLQLQPGKGRADAEMQAGPESEVRGTVLSVGDEVIRLRINGFVASGGGKEKPDLIATAEGMAEQRDILVGGAGEQMERRVVAQDFLDQEIDLRGGV